MTARASKKLLVHGVPQLATAQHEYWTCGRDSHRHKTKETALVCVNKQEAVRARRNAAKYKPWTKEQTARLLEQHEAGARVCDLAKKFKRSSTTISSRLAAAKRRAEREKIQAEAPTEPIAITKRPRPAPPLNDRDSLATKALWTAMHIIELKAMVHQVSHCQEGADLYIWASQLQREAEGEINHLHNRADSLMCKFDLLYTRLTGKMSDGP